MSLKPRATNFKPEDVRFDERGLVPAVVQDARTREVLTLAYMNEESLRRTLAEGETWFWSRSRAELWHKGATSGHTQRVVELRLDCDSDALVLLVEPRGPACHTGAVSCFQSEAEGLRRDEGRRVEDAQTDGVPSGEGDIGVVLAGLYAVVEGRRREMPEGAYTTYLFEQGLNKILKKVGEESAETIIAAKDGDLDALTLETADLVYHLLVLMVERGLTLEALARELARRRKGRRKNEQGEGQRMSDGEMRGDGGLQALLDFSVTLARGAGEITLRYFRREFETRLKGKDNFVTQADVEAEEFLRRRIAEEFPDDAVIGEEGGERGGTSGRRWIIDPIDGTYSFVHGVPFYGVLIGVEIEGEPTVGVINIPALGEIVYAARGLGCFWNGAPARVSQTSTLEDALLLCTDFGSCERYGFGPAADELQRRASMRRTWGDCYGYVLVATGRADVMLDPAMNVWDCAALMPVLEEAGGTFTDWGGRRSIHSGNAVATNGLLFGKVMRIIEERRQISRDFTAS